MQTSVIAAVICRDGRYLVCQRPKHKRHGGLWEFPGGKLEDGESLTDAANRELSEELGLTVISIGPELFSAVDPNSPFVVNFVDVEVSGEPLLIEHDAFQWLTLSELPSLELAPSDRKFVEYLLRTDRGQPTRNTFV